jgi:DNA (cytosine-5)-methyltransferase 1
MWILPSTVSPCFPVLPGSTWVWPSLLETCASSLTWRGKPTPAKSWLRAWKKKIWIQRLFGRTCPPLMADRFVDWWTSSLADSPCQDISVAGKQAGIGGKRSGLWKQYLRIVDEVRPGLVIIENVSALVTSGLEVVLADLAALGFDAEWGTLRASDVGATHRRDRIFIMAHSHSGGLARVRQSRLREDEQEYGQNSIGGHDAHRRSGASVANAEGDGRGQGWSESDTEGETGAGESGSQHVAYCDDAQREGHTHAQVTRADGSFSYPPCPDDLDRWSAVVAKRPDLEPSVCRVADGLAHRVDRLRLTGNGVVPAQAAHAIRQLLRRILTLIT